MAWPVTPPGGTGSPQDDREPIEVLRDAWNRHGYVIRIVKASWVAWHVSSPPEDLITAPDPEKLGARIAADYQTRSGS